MARGQASRRAASQRPRPVWSLAVRTDGLKIWRAVTLGRWGGNHRWRGSHPVWHSPDAYCKFVTVCRVCGPREPHRRTVLIKSRPARLDDCDVSIIREFEECRLHRVRGAYGDHVAPADLLNPQHFPQVRYGPPEDVLRLYQGVSSSFHKRQGIERG